jgi:hypothetical protein
MKIDTVVTCGWTTQPCARENDTALLVQVEGSTVKWTVHLDVAGANSDWALTIGLELGLGLDGVDSN